MGIKPLDLQVNLSQINRVAQMQQHEHMHSQIDQKHHAQHILREGEEHQHTVIHAEQPTNDESTVKDRKESEKRKLKYRKRKKHKKQAISLDRPLRPEDEEGEEKGHLVDFFR